MLLRYAGHGEVKGYRPSLPPSPRGREVSAHPKGWRAFPSSTRGEGWGGGTQRLGSIALASPTSALPHEGRGGLVR